MFSSKIYSGWWWAQCGDANLNGVYRTSTCRYSEPFNGITWMTFQQAGKQPFSVEMKVRSAVFGAKLDRDTTIV
jgi:hypothetical protein